VNVHFFLSADLNHEHDPVIFIFNENNLFLQSNNTFEFSKFSINGHI